MLGLIIILHWFNFSHQAGVGFELGSLLKKSLRKPLNCSQDSHLSISLFNTVIEKAVTGSYQIDQLRQPEAQLDGDFVGVVGHRPDQPVIVGQEIVIQSFGIRVGQSLDQG